MIQTRLMSSGIREFFAQQRDWTCGLAALRTLLTKNKFSFFRLSEEILVEHAKQLGMKPGPRSAEDLKRIAGTFYKREEDNPILTKCDFEDYDIVSLFKDYNLAIECSIMGGHWLVIMDIITNDDTTKVRLYDSYYNSVIELDLKQFNEMWEDKILTNTYREFIAIRR